MEELLPKAAEEELRKNCETLKIRGRACRATKIGNTTIKSCRQRPLKSTIAPIMAYRWHPHFCPCTTVMLLLDIACSTVTSSPSTALARHPLSRSHEHHRKKMDHKSFDKRQGKTQSPTTDIDIPKCTKGDFPGVWIAMDMEHVVEEKEQLDNSFEGKGVNVAKEEPVEDLTDGFNLLFGLDNDAGGQHNK